MNDAENHKKNVRPFRLSLRKLVDWKSGCVNLTCDKCGVKGIEVISDHCKPEECDRDGGCEFCPETWKTWTTWQVLGNLNVIFCSECSAEVHELSRKYDIDGMEFGIVAAVERTAMLARDLGALFGVKLTIEVDGSGMIRGRSEVEE